MKFWWLVFGLAGTDLISSTTLAKAHAAFLSVEFFRFRFPIVPNRKCVDIPLRAFSETHTIGIDQGDNCFKKYPSLFPAKRRESLTPTQRKEWNIARLDSLKSEGLSPIRVFASLEVRKRLKLRGKEKRQRLFLPRQYRYDPSYIITAVKEAFPLGELPVELWVHSAPKGDDVLEDTTSSIFPLSSTNQLVESFQWADKEGLDLNIYIELDSSYRDPDPLPWLINLPDLSQIKSYHMLSFYKFTNISDPESFAMLLTTLWRPLEVLGRIYVASEGINAQMAVPCLMMDRFEMATKSIDKLNDIFFNKDSIVDVNRNDPETMPFRSLHVRVRDQIVSDGMSAPLDWKNRIGDSLSPAQWHNMVNLPESIVLDCRNEYETDIGTFESAEPLNTAYFRESWSVLRKRLEGTPINSPIMTYCTGGIRCVKVAAFLEQELGFTNVTRLEGGIINYARYVRTEGLDSKFKGSNYVFDNRMGEKITHDVLGQCDQCMEPFDDHRNCANPRCHTRFIQCTSCSAKYSNCCCNGCKEQLKYDLQLEQVSPRIRSLSDSIRSYSNQPWLKPHPFQNSTLNLMFDNVIAANQNTGNTHRSVTQISELLHADRALVIESADTAENDFVQKLKKIVTSVTSLSTRDGEIFGEEILQYPKNPYDIIILNCGNYAECVNAYNHLMNKAFLGRHGLLAILLNGISSENIQQLLLKLEDQRSLVRASTLTIGEGVIFAGWKGSR